MTIPLPLFVAVPLAASFIMPFFGKKTKSVATALANIATACLLVMAIYVIMSGQSGIYKMGRWSIPMGINMVLDGFSGLMLLTISIVSFAAMLFSIQYMEQYTAKPKFLSLFLLMVAGMNGVVLSGDIFNMFVFLEIASISSYALVGFGCEHEELEASFKYMVLGSVASMFILFGIGMVYGTTGSLNLAYISKAIQQSGLNNGLYFALAMFIVGFGLKAALVPFHAWLPDAHPSAPAPISAMFSGVLIKALGVYALIRIIFNIFGVSLPIGWILVTLGVLSMVIGVFLAVGQWDFKRLLAYHSISQMGYVVLGVGIGAVVLAQGKDPAWASLAILGGLFHLMNHSVFKSLLFLTSGSIEIATGTRQLKELGGLGEKMPITRTMCTIASAAIAGVPPFNGFWSKLLIVLAAVKAQFYGLAAVTVLVSLVTLISFLKVQRYIFLGDLPDKLNDVKESKGSMIWSMGVLACLCIVMGLFLLWGPLREQILTPAVQALVQNVYSSEIISMQ